MRQNVKRSLETSRSGDLCVKIWYDACTGKHVRYGSAIAKRFRDKGHEVIFTTRKHPDTVALAQALGEDPIVIGEYDPTSLNSRLEESANRIIQFSCMFKANPPDLAIAHQSVELCRTAFGLGIPIILTADTPHAYAVNRLTLPFADAVVVSEALPNSFLRNYCAKNVVRFKGVDEAAWIKGLKPPSGHKYERPLIVVRELETRAAYAIGAENPTSKIAKALETYGHVLVLNRYSRSAEFVDSALIAGEADLVVSAGGTLAREAALQGVPSIVVSDVGRTYVNTYLARKGFPILISSPSRVKQLASKYLTKRVDVTAKLEEFENPVDVIENLAVQITRSP